MRFKKSEDLEKVKVGSPLKKLPFEQRFTTARKIGQIISYCHYLKTKNISMWIHEFRNFIVANFGIWNHHNIFVKPYVMYNMNQGGRIYSTTLALNGFLKTDDQV